MLFVNTIPIRTLVAVAALVATGAFADVTIGGNINQSITTSSKAGVNTTGLYAATAGNLINFSGSEDLGSGLKASFKFEQGLGFNNTDAGGGLFGAAKDGSTGSNREAWVALSGAFGGLTLGNQYTNAFNVVAAIDPNGITNSVGFGGEVVAAATRQNMISYALPTIISGLSINVQRANAIDGNGVPTSGDVSSGAGVFYATGALFAAYSKETTGADSNTAYSASYDLGVAKLGYSHAETATNKTKNDSFAISAPIGEAVKIALTNGTTKVDTASSKYAQYGAYYSLSKRTSLYAVYGTQGTDGKKQTSVGVNHAF